MVTPNLVILQLLHQPSDPMDFLRLCWDKQSPQQKKEIFYFLFNTQQNKAFFSLLRQELNNESTVIPWSHLISLLKEQKIITDTTIDHFIDAGANADEFTRFRIHQFRLNSMWEEFKEKKLNEFALQKQNLLNELTFARQQGLKEQRLKILNTLRNNYAQDPEIEKILLEEKEFKARHSLAKASARRQSYVTELVQKDTLINSSERNHLLEEAKVHITNNPSLASSLTIMFYQMDLLDEALQIIDAVTTPTSDLMWYEVMICLESKKYVRGLAALQKLKTFPEEYKSKSFSVMYYHAQFLYQLGHKSEAIHIMRNVVKIRPQFKSAISLLNNWEHET